MKRKYLLIILGVTLAIAGCSSATPEKKDTALKQEIKPEIKQEIVKMEILTAKPYANANLKGRGGMIPEPDALFEKTAIVSKTKGEQYVYTDNMAGYSDLYTKSYTDGEIYNISGVSLINSFAVMADDVIVDRREKDSVVKIYPYGSETLLAGNIAEQFYLHKKVQAVTFSVTSKDAKKLSILPVFQFMKRNTVTEIKDGMAVITIKGRDEYTAVVFSDTDMNFTDISESKRTDVNKIFYGTSNLKLMLTTTKILNNANVTVVFDKNRDNAIAKAVELSKKDSITELKQSVYDLLTQSFLWTSDEEYSKSLSWAKLSAYSMVSNEFGKGIWAGLPWFRDNWGRDTFISVPGTLLVSGLFDDTKAVITNFSKYQNKGDLMLEAEFADKTAKDAAVKFIKDNFVYRVKVKDNKIYNQLLPNDMGKMDEINSKVVEMNKITGISAKCYVEQSKNYGRIPNRVSNPEDIIYNTTDGTPWMIREIYEYIMYTGDMEYAKEIYPVVKLAIESAKKNYVDEQGFLTHADADTWMDAKVDEKPWSPRGNRANDIQALWFITLRSGSYIAEINSDTEKKKEWEADADKLKNSFEKVFWDVDKNMVADRVEADGNKDLSVRPNQLMLLTIPFDENFIEEGKGAQIVKNSINALAFPYGIASLAPTDEYFHPYHITCEKYEKDAAYHNGTIWGWNSGFAISAMTEYGYQNFAYKLTKNLSDQILKVGCLGSMSENVEALPDRKGNMTPSGTYSQAWSVAEFNRNGYQDYLGFRPDMIKNTITFAPHIPDAWNEFYASAPFGKNGKFDVKYIKDADKSKFSIKISSDKDIKVKFEMPLQYEIYSSEFNVSPKADIEIVFNSNDRSFYMNGDKIDTKLEKKSYNQTIGELKFLEIDKKAKFNSTDKSDYMRGVIEKGEYKINRQH